MQRPGKNGIRAAKASDDESWCFCCCSKPLEATFAFVDHMENVILMLLRCKLVVLQSGWVIFNKTNGITFHMC
ncbi:hypothetical protein FF1_031128 [Malus domestica]